MPLYVHPSIAETYRAIVLTTSHTWQERMISLRDRWEILCVSNEAEFLELLQRKTFDLAAYSRPISVTASLRYDLPPLEDSADTQPLTLLAGDFSLLDPLQNTVATATTLDHPDIHFSTISSYASDADLSQWFTAAARCTRLTRHNQKLVDRLSNRRSALIGQSAAMERLRQQVATAAQYDWPVVIQGETGTGRNLVARSIHELSLRSHRPLLEINCRVYTSTMFEKELFGETCPETGKTLREGRFDQADGGTIVLDGIETIAMPLQQILAQVLADRTYFRLGDPIPHQLTARVLAITSENLETLSQQNHFRRDLLQHFEAPILTPPPLREIRSDIPALAENLLGKIARRLGVLPRRLTPETFDRLQTYHWPENIKELEMVLERSCAASQGTILTSQDVETWIARQGDESIAEHAQSLPTLAQMERQLIETTFARCAGNRELTARTLDIGIRTLSGKLREYGYPPRGGPGSNRQRTNSLAEWDAA